MAEANYAIDLKGLLKLLDIFLQYGISKGKSSVTAIIEMVEFIQVCNQQVN